MSTLLRLPSFMSAPFYGLPNRGRYERSFATILGRYAVAQTSAHNAEASGAVMRRFRYALYFASGDGNAAQQVIKWFKNGFLHPEQTLIVGKVFERAVLAQIRAFENERLSYLFYRYARDLDFSRTRAVFHPYNTMWTPSIVASRAPEHVFIGHGESDKAGSSSPLIRIYDRIFVSGDLAIERLLSSGIINSCDVTSKRVVRVGMPYLDEPVSPSGDTQELYLLYAPTWEGGEATQRYSSLENGYGIQLVRWLLEQTSQHVVFRPHPSTGQRDPAYVRHLCSMLEAFQGNPRFHVQAEQFNGALTGAFAPLHTQWTRLCGVEESVGSARWVITDVGSMASAAIHHRVPFALVHKQPRDEAHPEGLSRLAAVHLCWPHEPPASFRELLTDAEAYRAARAAVLSARDHCCSVEPELESLPVRQRVDAIFPARAD
jgi:hypothetical protein